MSKDHIIPQFILRGFAINPTAPKDKQKIMIFDLKTGEVETKKIGDSFSLKDFNSESTEKFLAYCYEYYVAKIYQRIKDAAYNNEKSITLTKEDFFLLVRFFVIMWRRNDIQMKKAKEMIQNVESFFRILYGDKYDDIKKTEYKDYSLEDVFNEHYDEFRKGFYDKVIPNTVDDDPTVQKTVRNYSFFIVKNSSRIHFLLHNTYATLNYMVKKGQMIIADSDMPFMMMYPISNELCFCGLFSEKEIDVDNKQFIIPIEYWADDDIKKLLIDTYVTNTATHLVVDKTNIDYVKRIKR